jgi:glucose-1-phosphate thymidylyltransferase
MSRRGIILAGGTGSRLFPMTQAVSKQLLPVYDKPMIYYPLSTLMLAGIRDILIITTPHDQASFQSLLKDGHHLGLNISYAVQPAPKGLPEAFIIAETWLAGKSSCLILGDNIYYGKGLGTQLLEINDDAKGATVFAYRVQDPERYGVVEFDRNGKVISIEEKPTQPKSKYAVTGLYFVDADAPIIAKSLKPSARGELEIIDVLRHYQNHNQLQVINLGRGTAWLDTGTPDSLLQAANFVEVVEKRQGLKIASVEEIAWRLGYISKSQLDALIHQYKNNDYAKYLSTLDELENP